MHQGNTSGFGPSCIPTVNEQGEEATIRSDIPSMISELDTGTRVEVLPWFSLGEISWQPPSQFLSRVLGTVPSFRARVGGNIRAVGFHGS
ncbi:hypothetical protein PAXRUDRAFT_825678 [Paxillus rubicundulus Ve08.2h10]|uniref:Unplaced genomic scaffold scaffold_151, whole genome shotgun sequence n=1 Tax=Paxillus rubicundulus Ve08.2h10 TaxID=930991 RepID=A0A0D0EAK9_9AGAM|nr:hypothetical protein PAXRUDRAFT_825678 [Paxillus rubicundulus Ve08.2h10]